MPRKFLTVARQSSPCEVQPPLKCIALDVRELPSWVTGERVKILHVVCEVSSLHAVCW